MIRKRKIFTLVLIHIMISAGISAGAIDLTISNSSDGLVEGTVVLDDSLRYEPVTVKVSNEEDKIIYLDQIYTDDQGIADFKYIHDTETAGFGTMTVDVIHRNESVESTYDVETRTGVSIICGAAERITDNSYAMPCSIENFDKEIHNMWIITAVHDSDGILAGAKLLQKELQPGDNVSEQLTVNTETGKEIRSFFLEPETLAPYCNAVEWIPSEEVTPEPSVEPVAILIESESGTKNFNPQLLTGTGVSNELMHLYRTTFDPDLQYIAEYTFNCDAAGVYDLQGIISKFNGYSADCAVSVNDEPAVHSSAAKKIDDVIIGVNGLADDLLDKFSFGLVTLNKGENKLVLSIENKNWYNTSVSFDADYFEFIPVGENALGAVITSENGGLHIFEKKNGASFQIKLDGIADKAIPVRYTVTDYFGKQRAKSTVTIPKGDYKGVIKTAGLDTGWYRLKLESSLINTEVDFVIVPNDDERARDEYDPFAIDLASSWHTDSHYAQRQYAKAARLAGADWVRDRFLWREVESNEGAYNYNYVIGDTDTLTDEGLKVTDAFHEAPSWAVNSGETLPKNPKIMYDFIKNTAVGLADYVDVIEIWNEQDANQFSKEGADRYAAMLKAAAIAANDSDVLIALGGLCTRDSVYNNHTFQNGVMDYIDIYNYHTHLDYDSDTKEVPVPQKEQMKRYELLAALYGIGDKPIWQTESGIRQFIKSGQTQLTQEQCTAQARHIVTAYLESVAAGVDKHFSFIGIPFVEGGADFGLFTSDGMPRPAYAAHAVMTKMLEGLSFYGTVHSLADGASGYAMYSDNKIIEILWSSTECSTEINVPGNIRVYDIMGNEIAVDAVNSKASIALSGDPVYAVFDRNEAPDNIYIRPREFRTPEKTAFTDTQKIVLFADFPVTNIETDKKNGYSLSCSDINHVSVTIYNFSDTEMTGMLRADAESDSFNAVCPTDTITVPAMGEQTVDIMISANDKTAIGAVYDLKIAGTFDGAEVSPLTAHINFNRGINRYVTLNGSASVTGDGWQSPAITKNIQASSILESDGVKFTLVGDGNAGQYYPMIYSRGQNLKNYDGIRLSVWFDKTVVKNSSNYMTVQIADRSSNFVLDNSLLIPIKEGWNDYSFSWSDFTQRVSGTAGSIIDILGSGMYVRIGVHMSQKDLIYKLSEVGLYKSGEKNAVPEIMVESSRDNNSIYVSGTLPEGVVPDTLRVYVDGKEVSQYTVSDRMLWFEYRDPSEGKHKLLVVAYTPTGYAVYKEIEI